MSSEVLSFLTSTIPTSSVPIVGAFFLDDKLDKDAFMSVAITGSVSHLSKSSAIISMINQSGFYGSIGGVGSDQGSPFSGATTADLESYIELALSTLGNSGYIYLFSFKSQNTPKFNYYQRITYPVSNNNNQNDIQKVESYLEKKFLGITYFAWIGIIIMVILILIIVIGMAEHYHKKNRVNN